MLNLLFVSAFLAGPNIVWGADQVDFNRDVRPILSDKCFFCHGPDDKHREADLRLDQAPDSGDPRVVMPGKPDDSELMRRVLSTDADERMPPPKSGKSLSPAEIATLRRWIEQGASWSAHWAYVRPVRHEPPMVRNNSWPANWIDQFILARLEREAIEPSADADAITLIRRLSFDLRGLPPSPAEVDQFTQDFAQDASSAMQKWVDQFLATSAYGERMAVYWLDLVRFADTVGYHGDQEHHISPYRDWVIDAFIDNLPFDQFTREQLAGDLLPDSGVDQKIASGYNRLLQTSHEGGVQAKEYLAMYAADRMRNLSNVWMGATLGCAQCHSHKFDPYTLKDFYSLVAFFADIDEAQHLRKGSDSTPTVRAPELKVLTKRERARVAELTEQLEKLNARLAEGSTDEAAALREQIAAIEKQRADIENYPRLTMITVSIEPREIRLLPRGNWLDDSGPVMQPAIPEFLGKLETGDRRPTRLDLANWLVDSQRGVGLLTARVMVNRFWYLLFGSGLSRSLEDFGGQGEPPDHPELLDRLAWEFVDSGWNVKHLVKQIALSRAYRQSSVTTDAQVSLRDPENRLFARQGRFRLPAEFIRDNALAVSGLLVDDIGGASVRPYQPPGYYKYLNFPTREYRHHADDRQWRRGVYVHWQRQFLHPMMKAFDAPRREECTAQRPRSNTPLSALTLLNDSSFLEAARVFAARIVSEGGATEERKLEFAFRLAVSRLPDNFELDLLLKLLADTRQDYRGNEAAAKQLISTGQAPVSDQLPPAEVASWTVIARLIFNLSEMITRS